MVHDDVAALIVSDGFGTVAADLFVGFLPDAPDAAAAVLESQGGPATSFFGEASPAIERPAVQLLVRGAASEAGETAARLRIERMYRALVARGAFTVNSTRYLNLVARQPPFDLGRDESRRPIFGVNLDVEKEPTPLP